MSLYKQVYSQQYTGFDSDFLSRLMCKIELMVWWWRDSDRLKKPIKVDITEYRYVPLMTWFDLIYCVQRHFQQYFSYILANSFRGGRSRSTRSEPPTMGTQLVNFITCGSPRFICRPTALFCFARAVDVRELYIQKTADLLLQLSVDTFPRFVAIGFYFLSETLI